MMLTFPMFLVNLFHKGPYLGVTGAKVSQLKIILITGRIGLIWYQPRQIIICLKCDVIQLKTKLKYLNAFLTENKEIKF